MINKEKLAMMKSSAFLINTARGGLVNENDLLEACKNGVIAGAGLDVIANEPMLPNNPLYKLNNILITPHIGGNTVEAAIRASYMAAMGVAEMYEGKVPTWPIPLIDYNNAVTYIDTKESNKTPVGMFDY
jgi:D-3-phosphoglycerate dehydrogenase